MIKIKYNSADSFSHDDDHYIVKNINSILDCSDKNITCGELYKNNVFLKKIIIKNIYHKMNYYHEKKIHEGIFQRLPKHDYQLLFYDDDAHCLIFEYGGNVINKIDWCSISLDKKLDIILKILNDINDLIKVGILHNDIKTDNIVYDEQNDIVKLIDYGIAHLIPEDANNDEVLDTTFYSLSPEYVLINKICMTKQMPYDYMYIYNNLELLDDTHKLYINLASKLQHFALGGIIIGILLSDFTFYEDIFMNIFEYNRRFEYTRVIFDRFTTITKHNVKILCNILQGKLSVLCNMYHSDVICELLRDTIMNMFEFNYDKKKSLDEIIANFGNVKNLLNSINKSSSELLDGSVSNLINNPSNDSSNISLNILSNKSLDGLLIKLFTKSSNDKSSDNSVNNTIIL